MVISTYFCKDLGVMYSITKVSRVKYVISCKDSSGDIIWSISCVGKDIAGDMYGACVAGVMDL